VGFVRDMGKRSRQALIIAVLAASWLSFSLPREFFDPHLGMEDDIFCRTLSFMSAEVPVLPGPRFGRVVFLERRADPPRTIRDETAVRSNAIRAPPLPAAA